MKALILLYAVAFTLFSSPARVYADGEGCASYRPLNAGERAWFAQFSVLREALPPAPAGWSLHHSSREYMAPGYSGVPERICAVGPNYGIDINVYFERANSAADDAALDQAAQIKPDAAKQAQLDQLLAQQTALAGQMGAAAEKQDMAALEKLRLQAEPLSDQIQRLIDDIHAPQQQAVDAVQRDRSASVRVSINSRGGTCFGRPEAVNIAGAVAWRCAHDNNYHPGSTDVLDPARASMVIVFGGASTQLDPWQRRTREGQEVADQSLTLSTPVDISKLMQVQNVVVEIESDNPERVAGLYQGIKLDRLRTLLR